MAEAKKALGKSIQDFRAAHDKSYIVPRKITEALASLAAQGPEAWEYDVDFLKRAGLCTTDLASYREQFEDHIILTGGKNPKRAWAGTKKLAEELRGLVR